MKVAQNNADAAPFNAGLSVVRPQRSGSRCLVTEALGQSWGRFWGLSQRIEAALFPKIRKIDEHLWDILSKNWLESSRFSENFLIFVDLERGRALNDSDREETTQIDCCLYRKNVVQKRKLRSRSSDPRMSAPVCLELGWLGCDDVCPEPCSPSVLGADIDIDGDEVCS